MQIAAGVLKAHIMIHLDGLLLCIFRCNVQKLIAV